MPTVILSGLVCLLGMYTNLFIEIPEDAGAWQFVTVSIILLCHIVQSIAIGSSFIE